MWRIKFDQLEGFLRGADEIRQDRPRQPRAKERRTTPTHALPKIGGQKDARTECGTRLRREPFFASVACGRPEVASAAIGSLSSATLVRRRGFTETLAEIIRCQLQDCSGTAEGRRHCRQSSAVLRDLRVRAGGAGRDAGMRQINECASDTGNDHRCNGSADGDSQARRPRYDR